MTLHDVARAHRVVRADDAGQLRTQTACRLVLRLEWAVAPDQSHPRYSYICVQDEDMARTAAGVASERSPRGIRLVGASTSPTGGRDGAWDPLEPEQGAGWISGACA